ncbi:glycyl radical enzyme domain-containing protein [Thomasclavelia ramosa]|uniref:glycyl radical enzyme domain-containing protein n=1 Tax=Thomasclavelia ramosa TaxID=1547 RepID=UPI0022E39D75|nr:glycyl radical enzyme domain-containing protein [Thomasclavelia ramosa]
MNEIQYLKEFTRLYKENSHDKYNREVECHFFMHKENRTKITSDDYFLSCFPSAICGFGSRNTNFIYNCKLERLAKLIEGTHDVEKEKLEELYTFWADENDKERLRRYYPNDIKELMPYDDFENDYYTAYPLYRLGGAYLDFEKLFDLGIDGLIHEIDSQPLNSFLRACKKSLIYLKELIKLYRDDAMDINPELAYTLNELLEHRPQNMKEAIQLMWIYVGVSEIRNYGRMDNQLARFLDDEQDAYKNIAEYFKVIRQRNTIYNGRIILGGEGRHDLEKANKICSIALKVMKDLHLTEPQLTLRWSKDMPDSIFDNAIDCIESGCSYPLLYNDTVNIKNVKESMNVSYKEAVDYVPLGCGEYVLDHKSIGSPNGIINLAKVLEGLVNDGKCMITNKKIVKHYLTKEPNTFEELYDVYKQELDYQIDLLAKQEKFEYDYMNNHCGYLFNSILYDNCIDRGKSLLNGGIDYLGGTLETYGNVNSGDSLYAIKKLVFDDKEIRYKDMVDAIRNNFIGYEEIREKCLNVIKYGNDNPEVDEMINELNQYVAVTTKSKSEKYGLSSYLIVIINNDANSRLGYRTAATFDGRKAYEPLANALTPQSGAEKNGVTAVLNTVSSLDVNNMAGAVYNLKLSHDLMNQHKDMVKELLKIYFSSGGSQIMISVINQEELKDAMIHPEKYPNLIVRVGGFSARFIDLSPLVQKEIVSRMVY